MQPDLNIHEAGPAGWFEATLRSARAAGLSFKNPRPPVSRDVSVNSLTLRYLDWGNTELPDLLFIHGFAQQAHSWDFAALALQDMFHVVAIDLRGHGESGWSPVQDYSFSDYYGDIGPIIGAAGLDKPVLCGLSLGGTIAYTYASRNPGGVSALIGAEAAPETRSEGRESISRFTAGPSEFDSLEILVERVKAYTPWRSEQQVRSALVHSVRQTADGKWAWKYDPAIRLHPGSPESAEARWEALAQLRVPTLFVRGDKSDIVDPEIFRRMTASVPCSSAVTVPDAGHRVAGDNPAAFNMAVREFLSREPRMNNRTTPEGR